VPIEHGHLIYLKSQPKTDQMTLHPCRMTVQDGVCGGGNSNVFEYDWWGHFEMLLHEVL